MLDFKNLENVATKQQLRSYELAEQFLQNIFNRIKFTQDDNSYPFFIRASDKNFDVSEEYENFFFGDSKDDFEYFLFAKYLYQMDFQGNLFFTIYTDEKDEYGILKLLKDVLLNNGFTVTKSGCTFKRNIFED